MRLIAPLLIVCLPAIVSAQCENLIALSRVSTVITSDKESVEQHAENFCSEYRKSQSTGSSISAGASFKFLQATFGSSNVHADEVAGRYCSAKSGYSAQKDAYRQYVEAIAPGAFQAVETCMKLQGDIVYSLASHTATEFSILATFRNSRQDKQPARLEAHPTAGITCNWSNGGGPNAALEAPNTKLLECKRTETMTDGSVTVFWANAAVTGSSLVLPWPATNVPTSVLQALNTKLDRALQETKDALRALNLPVGGAATGDCTKRREVGMSFQISGQPGNCKVSFSRKFAKIPIVTISGDRPVDSNKVLGVPVLSDVTQEGFTVKGWDTMHNGIAAVDFIFSVLEVR